MLMLFKTCISFFILLNTHTKKDILENVDNQTVDGSHTLKNMNMKYEKILIIIVLTSDFLTVVGIPIRFMH